MPEHTWCTRRIDQEKTKENIIDSKRSVLYICIYIYSVPLSLWQLSLHGSDPCSWTGCLLLPVRVLT